MTRGNLFASAVLAALVLVATALTSCKESEEEGEYDNWKARNEHYIDSIASVARSNRDGSWTILRSFTLSKDFPLTESSENYVFVQKLEEGTGTEYPLYADSIRVHYSGRLIPTASYPQGTVFDKSYASSTFNPLTDVPTLFSVNQLVTGFSTAVMNMVVGDKWRVFIPYQLGYGTQGSTDGGIPGYSTLVIDIQLAKIYKFQVDTDTKWWTKRRD